MCVCVCAAVNCPSLSTGTDVASGCTCDAGYSGAVTATDSAPYYSSTCTGIISSFHSTLLYIHHLSYSCGLSL